MKIVLGVVLLGTSLLSQAFEYHGIKSGMSTSEVDSLTGCTEYCSSIDYSTVREFFGGVESTPPSLSTMSFSYTSDSKLWRIQLSFWERDGTRGVAQSMILRELYPDAELQKSSKQTSYGSTDYINAMLLDTALFNQDVQKIYNETRGKY